MDVCAALKGNSMNHAVGCWLGDCFDTSVKRCPIKNQDMQLNNLTTQTTNFSVPYPDGYYRTVSVVFDEFDNKILKTAVVMKLDNKDNINEFK